MTFHKKTISRLVMMAVALGLWIPAQMSAQIPDDALRLGTPGNAVSARALGIGNAYIGVANDYSAIYWNPAGLAQATHGEFQAGFSYFNNSDNSTFLDQTASTSSSATTLNTLGVVYPVPTRRGSLVFAFGFNRDANFVSGVDATGFNPTSSIIQSMARNGDTAPTVRDNIIPYQVYLADLNANGTWKSPITGQVTQSVNATEEGGLNNWSVGGAVDISPNVSLGMTLTYVSGTYRYDRKYSERDTRGVYASVPLDSVSRFNGITFTDFTESDISGVNATFGLMYREPERYRFGFTVKTPTAYSIHDSFNTTASTDIRDAQGRPFSDAFNPDPASNDYDVRTPWVFGAGGSVILRQLMIAVDADMTDWTTLKFANANQDILNQNADMRTLFRTAFNLRAGAEYDFINPGIRLRAGYMYKKSPYAGDPTAYDKKYVTAGIGFMLGESTMLDFGYAHGWWTTNMINYRYADNSRVDENLSSNTFLLTLVARF